jgi:hypothetical protein
MAEKQVIEIGAKVEQAVREMDRLSKKISDFKDKSDEVVKTAGIAFAALSGFIGVAVKNYGEQERAINKLNQVLKNQGIFTEELSQKYQKLSSRMQEQSNFADEQVLSAIGTVQSYLGEIEVTEDLTKSILDLAQAKGMDLNSAAQLVGKSIASDTNALSRMGVAVDTTASKEEKLAQVIAGVNALMGGQAEAASKDVLGSLNQAKMALGDVMELIGEEFAPMISNVALKIKEFAKVLQENKEALKIGVEILGVTTALAGLVFVVSSGVTAFASLSAKVLAAGSAILKLGLMLALNPIGLALTGLAIAVAAFGTAWATNFGNIQEITVGTLSYLKTFISASLDKIIAYYNAFADIATAALSLDIAGIKKGVEQWKSININVIDEASKAYGKGYAEREKSNAKALNKEVDKTETTEKKKLKIFNQRVADEQKALENARKKEDESYQKFLTEKEASYWDSVIKDNEAATKAAQSLEMSRLNYYYDRLTSEEVASANSIEEINQININALAALKDIHDEKIRQIEAEKGNSLEAIELKKQAEFDYYKARQSLEKKIEDKTKDLNKNTISFYDSLIDKISEIASVIGSISSSIESAGQYGKNVAGGAGVNSAAIVTSDIATIPEKLNENIDNMYEAMLGAGDKFNAQLDRALSRLPEMVKSFAESFPKLAKSFADGIGPLMSAIFSSLTSIAQVFVANLGGMLTSIFSGVIPDLLRRFPEMFAILLEGLNVAFKALLESLPIIITEFFAMIPELINKINEAIPGFVIILAENILPIVGALIAGLVKASPQLILAWAEVSVAWAMIGSAISMAMAALTPVWATVGGWISAGMAALTPLWTAIGIIIGTAIDVGIIAGIPLLIAALGVALIAILYNNWSKIEEFFKNIFKAVGKVLSDIFETLAQILVYPYKLMWEGAMKIIRPLIDALKSIADTVSSITGSSGSGGVVNTVKDVFTPSKWRFNKGGMMPRYLAAGDFIPKGSDTVPAMLSPGEFVVNADATSKNLGLLKSINSGASVGAQEIVLRIVGDDDFGRLIEKSLVKMSTLGTGRLRVAVGSEA